LEEKEMIRAFYAAGSGLNAQQTAIDNAANNMANVSTTGYKKQDISFSDLLYSDLDGTASQNTKVGNGSRVSGNTSIQTQGDSQFTGNPLDFELTSDGFFGVLTQDGNVKYSRDGSFHVSSEDTGNYLVNASGDYVLGKDGNRISSDSENLINQIGVFNFANPYGLTNEGNNLFLSTATSGNAFAIDGKLQNGYLESSNVDLSTEMTDLIEIQKAYQFNAKLVQTADEIANITNNLR